MRVWLITSEFPDEFSGGIARYVDNFARLLGQAGHEIVVIARMGQSCDKYIDKNVRLIGIKPNHSRLNESSDSGEPDQHPAYPYNVMSYWPALSYQMAEEAIGLLNGLRPPDIIECQEYAGLSYYLQQRRLTERGLLEQTPVVIHLHGGIYDLSRANQEPRYRLPTYWIGQMEKFCIVAADALLSPSRFLAESVKRTFDHALDITTIPLPVAINGPYVPVDGQSGDLVYVGRLEVRKGVFPLVKACSRLWQAGQEFRLTLIGGDTDYVPGGTTVGESIQERFAGWIERGHLSLAGPMTFPDLIQRVRQAWAVVIPSLWENFPNTCMEAMAVGQVVLASCSGGQAEMINMHGHNGFLFDWDIPGDFEANLGRVLALTREQRLSIAHEAQNRLREQCSPEVVIPQRVRHFEDVMTRYAPRRIFPTVYSQPGRLIASATSTGDERPDLLSVIIPYYNLGDYLVETVESILRTTYGPRDIVIVDDGSTDSVSIDVLNQIESRQIDGLRVVRTENNGLASARNRGAEAAQGEFIAFVDADDLVEPDFFERCISVLRRYPNIAFVYSWMRYFGATSDIWPTWNTEFPYLLGHNMLSALAVIRRRAYLEHGRNKPAIEYGLEDYEGWISLCVAGGVGVSLPHPLVLYRVRPGSMSRTNNVNQLLYLYDLISHRHGEQYRQWGVELFNLQNANGPGRLWNHPAMDRYEAPQDYIAELERQRDKLWAEVQLLGKAWEEHVAFIKSQQAYIQTLEARCNEWVEHLRQHATRPPTHGNGIAWDDYIGGRLVRRLRQNKLASSLLGHKFVKNALKRTLGL